MVTFRTGAWAFRAGALCICRHFEQEQFEIFKSTNKRVFMCYFVQFKQHMDYICSILDNEINIFEQRPTIIYQNLRNAKHGFSVICEQEHPRRTGALFSTSNILSRSISSPVHI